MSTAVPRDVALFLEGYPHAENVKPQAANLEFYTLKRRCRPDNLLVDEIHTKWAGDYRTLESNHGFIQWLFPIREQGMNYQSQPLQLHELEAMKADDEVIARLIKSYELMLDFYGMQLVSTETGLISRAEPQQKRAQRYNNLCRSPHNNLRITRILKCLSELGLERLNAGFILHVLNEQSERGELNTHMLESSMDNWWANCNRNTEEREWIGALIDRVREDADFVFTRQMYEDALERRRQTGRLVEQEPQ
ncbi:hypothetical protein PHLGIDRAFT_86230 [Phlebiopsis gigantea 11061_1 CR5-6]|uniref:Opioid growth factor receptor (OGFr) conserved domain-containing protein n=1 Tax=Phlebiopsis gigantea (strain 11061_1 CR5-6) TaxID=745531 RepID=A0A0C3SB06_PHLG1|nr:hypothetical protein PHLGIDRAFT_86230 [Phlebiopsis gigantea 11061_1 CR5-6]